MKPQPTPARILTLPKWAQDHIEDIERKRSVAILRLDDFTNSQKPSQIYFDGWDCTGETSGPVTRRFFVQSHQVTVEAHRVQLNILIRDDGIDLSYSSAGNAMGEVAMIPKSYQKFYLVPKELMR